MGQKIKIDQIDTSGGGFLPPVSGNDGYALIEVGGVAAFRPIKSSYIVAPFAISGFAPGVGTQEVGAVVASPVPFTASYNRPPTTASIVDNQGNPALDVSLSPTSFNYPNSYTKTANNASVGFTLSAQEGVDPSVATSSIVWMPREFWGVGVDGLSTEADIEALASSALGSSRARTFTLTPGAGEHIYYAYPSSYGAATFTVNGFSGGFVLVGVVSVTNVHGVNQNYNLYKSVNAALGLTTVQVT